MPISIIGIIFFAGVVASSHSLMGDCLDALDKRVIAAEQFRNKEMVTLKPSVRRVLRKPDLFHHVSARVPAVQVQSRLPVGFVANSALRIADVTADRVKVSWDRFLLIRQVEKLRESDNTAADNGGGKSSATTDEVDDSKVSDEQSAARILKSSGLVTMFANRLRSRRRKTVETQRGLLSSFRQQSKSRLGVFGKSRSMSQPSGDRASQASNGWLPQTVQERAKSLDAFSTSRNSSPRRQHGEGRDTAPVMLACATPDCPWSPESLKFFGTEGSEYHPAEVRSVSSSLLVLFFYSQRHFSSHRRRRRLKLLWLRMTATQLP